MIATIAQATKTRSQLEGMQQKIAHCQLSKCAMSSSTTTQLPSPALESRSPLSPRRRRPLSSPAYRAFTTRLRGPSSSRQSALSSHRAVAAAVPFKRPPTRGDSPNPDDAPLPRHHHHHVIASPIPKLPKPQLTRVSHPIYPATQVTQHTQATK